MGVKPDSTRKNWKKLLDTGPEAPPWCEFEQTSQACKVLCRAKTGDKREKRTKEQRQLKKAGLVAVPGLQGRVRSGFGGRGRVQRERR